jgi:cytochrome c biogenesis protein CcdA
MMAFSVRGVTAQKNRTLTFYGDPNCDACVYRENVVKIFVSLHPDVHATYNMEPYYSNFTLFLILVDYLENLSHQPASIPALVLNDSGRVQVWYEGNITDSNLESWLTNAPYLENMAWIAFFSGLIVGIAPCLLLMMSVLGTTLVMVEERRKYITICAGLILGIVVAYTTVSAIFLALLNLIGLFLYFKYIFGAILITIGAWQIIDFRSEKSIIFGTPKKVKTLIKSFSEKNSGTYAFLLGFLFAFVKIPCFGGVFLGLLYNAWLSAILAVYILLYFAGMLIPIVVLLVALRIGIQPSRVNSFRGKYRPHLRMLSGIVLIVLTLVLLFFSL